MRNQPVRLAGLPGFLPWAALLAGLAPGCITVKTSESDTTADTTDADTDADTDSDTDADTDADSDADTDTDAIFDAVSATADLAEVIDVAATAGGLWAVGFDAAGEPAVVSVDVGTGAVTSLASGEPMVQPTGLAVSPDGATLYVADIGVIDGDGSTNGQVYSLPATGGPVNSLGVDGVIDLPGDVAAANGTGVLWVTGVNTSGLPAIFQVVPGGSILEEHAGAPLVDPLAIVASADDSKVYVVDSLGQNGSGALFAFTTPGFVQTVLATDFRVEFPGGVAVDPTDDYVYYSQTNTTGAAVYAGAALVRVKTDGTGWEVVSDTPTSLKLPSGVAAIAGATYLGDLSATAVGDVFAYVY